MVEVRPVQVIVLFLPILHCPTNLMGLSMKLAAGQKSNHITNQKQKSYSDWLFFVEKLSFAFPNVLYEVKDLIYISDSPVHPQDHLEPSHAEFPPRHSMNLQNFKHLLIQFHPSRVHFPIAFSLSSTILK